MYDSSSDEFDADMYDSDVSSACPEWQQLQLQRQSVSEEEQDREEERRRQLGEELLKKELEAEGTLMKKVGKRLANTYHP
ncbi:hypothetical protein RMATCC62417_12423 [Rhizopus microsporus]|nr:hypothetical protein RMATCC62417_12423 [Rhizopus microsporus]